MMGFVLFPAVFGQRLDETVAYEQKFGPHLVPILVEKCAEFILEHGVNEEGIFRLPGQDNLVKQLRDAFDAGERPSFDRCVVFACSELCLPSPLPGSGERTSLFLLSHGSCRNTSKNCGSQQKEPFVLFTIQNLGPITQSREFAVIYSRDDVNGNYSPLG